MYGREVRSPSACCCASLCVCTFGQLGPAGRGHPGSPSPTLASITAGPAATYQPRTLPFHRTPSGRGASPSGRPSPFVTSPKDTVTVANVLPRTGSDRGAGFGSGGGDGAGSSPGGPGARSPVMARALSAAVMQSGRAPGTPGQEGGGKGNPVPCTTLALPAFRDALVCVAHGTLHYPVPPVVVSPCVPPSLPLLLLLLLLPRTPAHAVPCNECWVNSMGHSAAFFQPRAVKT